MGVPPPGCRLLINWVSRPMSPVAGCGVLTVAAEGQNRDLDRAACRRPAQGGNDGPLLGFDHDLRVSASDRVIRASKGVDEQRHAACRKAPHHKPPGFIRLTVSSLTFSSHGTRQRRRTGPVSLGWTKRISILLTVYSQMLAEGHHGRAAGSPNVRCSGSARDRKGRIRNQPISNKGSARSTFGTGRSPQLPR